MTALEQILEHKVIAILRGCNPANIFDITQALYDGGIRLLEITLNSPGALDAIRQVSEKFGDRLHLGDRLLIGAGTVLTPGEAKAAIAAGARFILSPSLDTDVIRQTLDLGAVSVPGAFTATEILTAHRHGAHIVKVFPASVGPSYFRDLRGPLPHIRLMPTGGVNLDNIRDFHKAGAVAFGIGSALVPANQSVAPADLQILTARAAGYVAALR